MRLGGLLKFSLIDYPGKLAAVIFTQGCNYRCPFCHNPELSLPELFTEPLVVEDIWAFLEKRKGQLQGVVVTGGEPTIYDDLPEFLSHIKAMGFFLKLDTNGSRPDVLRELFERRLVDYVAMDIKSSLESYCKATGVTADIELIKASIQLIKNSGIAYEFRTTALKSIVTEADMAAVVALIGDVATYTVRRGDLTGKVLDYGFFADHPDYTEDEWKKIKSYERKGS